MFFDPSLLELRMWPALPVLCALLDIDTKPLYMALRGRCDMYLRMRDTAVVIILHVYGSVRHADPALAEGPQCGCAACIISHRLERNAHHLETTTADGLGGTDIVFRCPDPFAQALHPLALQLETQLSHVAALCAQKDAGE